MSDSDNDALSKAALDKQSLLLGVPVAELEARDRIYANVLAYAQIEGLTDLGAIKAAVRFGMNYHRPPVDFDELWGIIDTYVNENDSGDTRPLVEHLLLRYRIEPKGNQ